MPIHLFCTFLCLAPNSFLLQPALLQPFLLHFPPYQTLPSSLASLLYYLAHHFLPNVFLTSCPTVLPTLCSPPWPATHLNKFQLPQGTNHLLLSFHRHDATHSRSWLQWWLQTINSDDHVYITCCHCPEMFPCSVGRHTQSQNCLGIPSAT